MTRNSTRRLAAGFVAMLAFAALPTAAARAEPSESPSADGSGSPSAQPTGPLPAHGRTVFTIGITNDVDSLNPFVGILAESYETFALMYDTLTRYGAADFKPEPALAERWETSSDGLTWTYHIRRGVQWSDGKPLTAKDVEYTFNRIMNGEYEQTNYGNYVSNIESVTTTDDYTVVMKTKQPSPSMLALGVYILPQHIWEKVDGEAVQSYANETDVVGSGPFVLVERRTGEYLKFKANKQYWSGAPKIEEVVFRVFANKDAMAQSLVKGEIDFADDLSANVFETMSKSKGVTAVSAKYGGFNELAFNTGAATAEGEGIGNGHPALRDKQVRVAIDHAIDKQTLLTKVLRGHGTIATGIIPSLYGDLHYEPAGSEARGFDVAKANQILDAAGYAKGGDGIRTMPNDPKTKLDMRLQARSESQDSQDYAAYIQEYLAAIGIGVTVSVVANDNLTQIIGEGDYDMFLWGWVVEPDPDYQLSTFTCEQRSTKDGDTITAGLSDSFYCNPEFDALYTKQKGQIDPAARAATVKQAQQLVYNDAPYAMLNYYDDLQAYRSDRFSGLVAQPNNGGVLLFQWGTYTYLSIQPVAEGTTTSSSTARNVLLGVGGAVVLAGLVVGVLLMLRRRRTADERE
jgi:peptide/nickel transport system substrate-binding protein